MLSRKERLLQAFCWERSRIRLSAQEQAAREAHEAALGCRHDRRVL